MGEDGTGVGQLWSSADRVRNVGRGDPYETNPGDKDERHKDRVDGDVSRVVVVGAIL